MRKLALFTAALLIVILIPFSSFAQKKTFIKEYFYQASDEDSKNSSRVIAIREVKRLLMEELGSYLESHTEVRNFQLTRDQVTAITAGITSAEIMDEKWDGRTYWLKSKIVADPDDVARSIDSLRSDRQKTKELEDQKRRSEELLRENERLRNQLAEASQSKREELKAVYDSNIKNLSASEWFEKGYSLQITGNSNEAISAYNTAIELNPKYADAYNNRGIAYHVLGKYERAVKDYNTAIELNSKYADAYNNRGITYHVLGKYEQAIKDYNTAMALNPKYADACNNRGITYHVLGKYEQAIKDYSTAIELNSEYADAYNNRGIAYDDLGNNNQAIKDFKMAAGLGNKDAKNWLKRNGISW